METQAIAREAPASVLEAFLTVADLLPELLEKSDMAVWATNAERFLVFDRYGRFQIDIKAGDALTPGGTPDLVLKQGRKISRHVPPQVYGIPCKTVAVPVSGGVVGLSYSVETEEQLQDAMKRLVEEVETISRSSTDIATKATLVSDFMGSVQEVLGETSRQLEAIDRIREFVDDVAENSRYISLNALIEAHRVGEEGRGFAVVAKEMQSLSDKTRKSIGQISVSLSSIHAIFERLQSLIVQACSNLEAQSHSSTDIAASIQGIISSVRDIEKLTNKLA